MTYEEQIEFLKKTPTADLCDSMRRLGISGYTENIYCIQDKIQESMVGPALTVKYIPKQPGQQSEFKGGQFAFARMCTDGQVLVIDALGRKNWLTGGNVCRVTELAGAAGIVIDGCVRDKREISSHKMPVFCKGTGCRPYGEYMQLDAVNAPVDIDGCRVNPGDIVVGDTDGLVILPKDRIEEIIYEAQEIAQIEIDLAAAVERQASLEELNAIGGRKGPKRAR